MRSKIVVGVDCSVNSARAVKWCATHALALNAEVIAVHAVERPTYVAGVYPFPAPELTPEQRDDLLDLVTRDWCKPLANAGVTHRAVLIDGRPASGLMHVARAEHAELVVTGRRGRSGLAEFLLGSTSHELTHYLDRPLVIVP